MPWHRRCSGARVTFGLDSSVVPGDVAPEWLYRRGWPILRHRIGHDSLQRKPHSGRIIVKREQRGLVQDRSTRRVGVANQQTRKPPPARAERRCRTGAKRSQQRRRIIGLLLGQGRPPAARRWTAPAATSVIAHDHELVGQQIAKRFEMTGVSRRPHDQQHHRPTSAHFVIELCSVRAFSRK
jgi:hypothetical protein